MKRKLLCLLLALVLTAGLLPAAALAADEPLTVVISFEGLTLGQGIYVPPEAYTLDEINALVGAKGLGPYTAETLTAGIVTYACLLDIGLAYEMTGSWESGAYLSAVNGFDTGVLDIPECITENGGPSDTDNDGNDDAYLGEFDYSAMSGWMITVNDYLIDVGTAAWLLADAENTAKYPSNLGNTYVVRWQFTLWGYGADLGYNSGWGNEAYFAGANKAELYAEYARSDNAAAKAAALTVMEDLTSAQSKVDEACTALKNGVVPETEEPAEESEKQDEPSQQDKTEEPDAPAESEKKENDTSGTGTDTGKTSGGTQKSSGGTQKSSGDTQKPTANADYKSILNAALAQLAVTVSEPAFGTEAGEWSVLSLGRGGYYAVGSEYFEAYYSRVAATIQTTAASVNLNGALHKVKSTENSRAVLALTAIGKDPTNVGGVNLIGAYDANGLSWIKKQGVNGPIFALLALDSGSYATADTTLRNQLVEYILSCRLADGGWALSGTNADVDVTAMALQALAPYRDDADVAAASEKAFALLSGMQNDDGTFGSWGSVNSESISQVIVACCAWGIDPENDSRFVKNGASAVDALLGFYVESGRGFAHVKESGGYTGSTVNGMATDQSCYALVAYDRFVNGKNALYSMSDAGASEPDEAPVHATLSLPEQIENKAGTTFSAVISLDGFPADARLLDCILAVPDGVAVKSVTMGSRISGGEVGWNKEQETGKLRIVYFDAQKGSLLTASGDSTPIELMTVTLQLTKALSQSSVTVQLTGMSAKMSSEKQLVIGTENAYDTVKLIEGVSFRAAVLYVGDGIDCIPAEKTAIAVCATGIGQGTGLTYNDGTDSYVLLYSPEATAKSGVATYLTVIPSEKSLGGFSKEANYTVGGSAEALTFGDTNGDGVVNAQDAVNIVNYWLRQSAVPDDTGILAANVTGDARINTFDALAIAEYFVDGLDYAVVTAAAGK